MSAHEETNGASYGKYLVGFVLAVILTLLSFIPVMNGYLGDLSTTFKVIYLIGLALIQIFVQIVFFLHLNHGPDAKWLVGTMWFGALCVLVIIGGSFWAMSHLNWNMMGGSGRVERPAVTGEAVPGVVNTAPNAAPNAATATPGASTASETPEDMGDGN